MNTPDCRATELNRAEQEAGAGGAEVQGGTENPDAFWSELTRAVEREAGRFNGQMSSSSIERDEAAPSVPAVRYRCGTALLEIVLQRTSEIEGRPAVRICWRLDAEPTRPVGAQPGHNTIVVCKKQSATVGEYDTHDVSADQLASHLVGGLVVAHMHCGKGGKSQDPPTE